MEVVIMQYCTLNIQPVRLTCNNKRKKLLMIVKFYFNIVLYVVNFVVFTVTKSSTFNKLE